MPKVSNSKQTPETIRNIAKRMADCSGRLLAVADKLQENNVAEMTVSHFNAVVTGMERVEAFSAAVMAMMWKELSARGDFAVAEPEKPEKGKKK